MVGSQAAAVAAAAALWHVSSRYVGELALLQPLAARRALQLSMLDWRGRRKVRRGERGGGAAP